MAITETSPEADVVPQSNPWDTGDHYPAAANVLGSGDHKTLGRLYIGFALFFGVLAFGATALTTFDELPNVDILSADVFFQVFTLGHLGLGLLFAIPLFVGLATYLVPLQVGASTIAFPRAAAAAFWGWLLGSVLLIVSYAINGGIGGGRSRAVDLAYLSTIVLIAALLLATVCILTTVVALRTPGMYLDRTPMFSWGMFVAGSIWMLTLPVFLANLTLIYVDHHFGRPSDFGLSDLQWRQLVWLFEQPQVFAFAIPVLGAIGDIVVTLTGQRQRNRGVLLGAIAAFGIFSFGAFAEEAFNGKVWEQVLYVGISFAIVVPVLVLLGGLAATLRSGSVKFTTGLMASVLAGLAVLLATVGAAVYSIKPLKLHDSDAYQQGLLILVIGVVALAGIGALHHWAAKTWGRMANDGLGKLAALIAFGGAVIGGLGLMILGFGNRFDGINNASDALTVVSAVGAALVLVALVLTAVSLGSGRRPAADDPWSGQTLEWATGSPPPEGNFGELAAVVSAAPLLDSADTAETEEAS